MNYSFSLIEKTKDFQALLVKANPLQKLSKY